MPDRNSLLRLSVPVVRLLTTYLLVLFAPWRAGRYLANHKKGALAGPIEVLAPAAALFYAAHFTVAGWTAEVPLFGFDLHGWQVKVAVYAYFCILMFFVILLFHGFVKAFGSHEGFSSTLVGWSYSVAVWLLIAAGFLTAHIGALYRFFSLNSTPLSRWELSLELVVFVWVWIASVVVIQCKIHRLRWYRVVASNFLAALGYGGWAMFFIWWWFVR